MSRCLLDILTRFTTHQITSPPLSLCRGSIDRAAACCECAANKDWNRTVDLLRAAWTISFEGTARYRQLVTLSILSNRIGSSICRRRAGLKITSDADLLLRCLAIREKLPPPPLAPSRIFPIDNTSRIDLPLLAARHDCLPNGGSYFHGIRICLSVNDSYIDEEIICTFDRFQQKLDNNLRNLKV